MSPKYWFITGLTIPFAPCTSCRPALRIGNGATAEPILIDTEDVFDFVRGTVPQFFRNLIDLERLFLVRQFQRSRAGASARMKINPGRKQAEVGTDPKGRVVAIQLAYP